MSGLASKPCVTPPSSPDAAAAPPAGRFPAVPQSWYFLARSRRLRDKPLGIEIAGKRLALFRDAQCRPAVIDGDCAHMGADLSGGCVAEGRLQCPFHGWEYDGTGRCVRIPGRSEVPPFARQTAYAAGERHGMLFAFLSGEPLFALPEFFEPPASPLVAARPARYAIECPWYMFGANGFDLQHFALVHDRQLVSEPRIDSPSPFARRIRFCSRVIGTSATDRVIRGLIGERVEVTITVWAGNLIAVSARFRRTVSRLLFAIAPLDRDRTRVDLIVFAERGPLWRRWTLPLSLWLRRMLSLSFIAGDVDKVRRAVYRPGTLVEADRAMTDYYCWLAALSQSKGDHL